MTARLRIVHLYPDLLGTYGDRGNVICLAQRARWRGIDVTVEAIERGQPLPPEPDLIFVGGGQDRAQQLVAPELLALAPEIAAAAEAGTIVFAVCGGYQLLGTHYRTADGDVPGLSLLDIWTESCDDRIVGNAAIRCRLGDVESTLVGFENHGGRTHVGPRAKPLGKVVMGSGNNGTDGTEGAVQGNVIGTYLHGPVLPRNAWFADGLLRLALAKQNVTLEELDDRFENAAHEHSYELAKRRTKGPLRRLLGARR